MMGNSVSVQARPLNVEEETTSSGVTLRVTNGAVTARSDPYQECEEGVFGDIDSSEDLFNQKTDELYADIQRTPDYGRDEAAVFVGDTLPLDLQRDDVAVEDVDYGLGQFLDEYGLHGEVVIGHGDAETTLLDTRNRTLETDPVLWSLAGRYTTAPRPASPQYTDTDFGAMMSDAMERWMSDTADDLSIDYTALQDADPVRITGDNADYLVTLVGTALDADILLPMDTYSDLERHVTMSVPEMADDGFDTAL